MSVINYIINAMTYSLDFRKKVLKTKTKHGLSFKKVAARFCISKSAVVRWSKNLEGVNKRNKPWTKLDKEKLKIDIEEFPDSYSYERAKRLGVSASGIRYAKQRLGVTYKKNSQSSEGGSREKVYVLPKN
jgi:transposase